MLNWLGLNGCGGYYQRVTSLYSKIKCKLGFSQVYYAMTGYTIQDNKIASFKYDHVIIFISDYGTSLYVSVNMFNLLLVSTIDK